MSVEKNQPSPEAIHKLHLLVVTLIKQPNFKVVSK